MKKIFDGFDPDEYADEAKERWGDTDAYKISMQRTKSYTEAASRACGLGLLDNGGTLPTIHLSRNGSC
jgi:hypothetical protein